MSFLRNIIRNNSSTFNKGTTLLNHNATRTVSTGVQNYQLPNQQLQYRSEHGQHSFAQMIKDFMPLKNMFQLMRTYERLGGLSSSQALFLLRNCGDSISLSAPERRCKLTSDVWDLIMKYGVTVDVSHFNSLLQAYNENGTPINIDEILELMKTKNVIPNRITYGKFIHYYCQNGNIEGANRILEIMNNEKHSIDETIFNSLIIGNARANDLEGALQVLDIMKEKQMGFDRNTYNCLLQVYSEMNKLEETKETLARAEKDSVVVSPLSLFDAYATFVIHKNKEAADMMFSMLKSDQRVKVISPTLRKLIKAGEYEAAFQIIDFAAKKEPFYGNYLRLLANYAPLNVALEQCHKLNEDGLVLEGYNRLLTEFAHLKQHDKLLSIMQHMRKKNIPITEDMLIDILFDMDPKSPHFKDDLVALLNQEEFFSTKPYMVIFKDLTVAETQDVFHHLNMHLPNNVFRQLACVMDLLKKDDFSAVLQVLFDMGGFAKVYHFVTREVARAFARNTSCTEEMGQICILFNLYSKFTNKNEGASLYDLINFVDFEMSVGNVPNKEEVTENLFQTLVKYGIHLTKKEAEMIKDSCSNLTSYASGLLDELVDATPTDLYTETMNKLRDQNKRFLSKRRNQNANTFTPLSRMTEKDKIRAFSDLVEGGRYLDAMNVYKFLPDSTSEVKLKLVKLFYERNSLAEVVTEISALQESNVTVPRKYLIYHIESLISVGRVDDALKNVQELETSDDQRIGIAKSFLLAIAKLPESERLSIKNILIEKNYLDDHNMKQLDIIIDIQSNNLEKAYEKIREVYNVKGDILWKQEYYKYCIKNDKPQMLQLLHDYIIEKHGKTHALHTLGHAFLELKKVKQAVHVFQTLGNQCRPEFMVNIAKRYKDHDRIEDLENLMKVALDVQDKIRTLLHETLIMAWMYRDDADKALECWTDMQTENLQVSDRFAVTFAKYLQRSNRTIPFSVPHLTLPVNIPYKFQGPLPQQRSKLPLLQLQHSTISADEKMTKFCKMMIGSDNTLLRSKPAHTFLSSILTNQNATKLHDIMEIHFNVPGYFYRQVVQVLKKENRFEEMFTLIEKRKTVGLEPDMEIIKYVYDILKANPQIAENEAKAWNAPMLHVGLWNFYLREERYNDADEIAAKIDDSNKIMLHFVVENFIREGKEQILEDISNKIQNEAVRVSNRSRFVITKILHLCRTGTGADVLQYTNEMVDAGVDFKTFSTGKKDILTEAFTSVKIPLPF